MAIYLSRSFPAVFAIFEIAVAASGSNGVPTSLNGKYLNESAAGPWTLRIADDDFLVAGQFVQWELLLGGGPGCPQGAYGDLNGDREVTIADITGVITAFGDSCEE